MMDAPAPSQLPLYVMPKPVGPLCNLACAYCYYLPKQQLYPGRQDWRISDKTLDCFIRQYIAIQPPEVEEIVFGWQGGEPTLAGIDFFQRAIELQRMHAPPGKRCANAIQTNGILLDDAWCVFLREQGFLVGLSIDGPADLHDRYRRDRQGKPTFDRVLQAMERLQRHGVTFNALTVINRHNGSHPRRVYRFLVDHGIEFIQFIPIVESAGGGPGLVSDRSVQPGQFGRFMIEVFDEWIRRDVGGVFVQTFDQLLSAWLGQEPGLCIFQRQCGRGLVLEHNGDLYSCDHFVVPECRLGNIHERPIGELAALPQQIEFGRAKETTLPKQCRRCEFLFACHGECPRNRLATTPDGEPGLNYLCEGYRLFFRHIDPCMKAMAQELRHGRPAANVMHQLAAQQQPPTARTHAPAAAVGRNDPCPCGSGRKYKHCCLKRP